MDRARKGKDLSFSVYVFGDQTNSFEARLTQLLHDKGCSLLSSFFEQVHHALRIEISRLPVSQRSHFPRFTSILDLLARKSDLGSNPALEFALLCITQVASFIKYKLWARD